jgi:hypothetical protein
MESLSLPSMVFLERRHLKQRYDMSCDELLDYLKDQGCNVGNHSPKHYMVQNPKPNPGGSTLVKKGDNLTPELIELICGRLHVPIPPPKTI